MIVCIAASRYGPSRKGYRNLLFTTTWNILTKQTFIPPRALTGMNSPTGRSAGLRGSNIDTPYRGPPISKRWQIVRAGRNGHLPRSTMGSGVVLCVCAYVYLYQLILPPRTHTHWGGEEVTVSNLTVLSQISLFPHTRSDDRGNSKEVFTKSLHRRLRTIRRAVE